MEERQRIDESELNARIDSELHHYAGVLPPLTNAAWRRYLAACIEWGLIEPGAHGRLLDGLPPLDQEPSVGILLGYEGNFDSGQ